MAKSYKTSWTLGGTARAAESLSIPVNAYQKNLLTQNQATGGDTLGDTTGFTAFRSATITRDTTEVWNGTGSIKVVTPNAQDLEGVQGAVQATIGKIYTFSAYLKGSGTIKLAMSGNVTAYSSDITLTSTWTRYQFAWACDLAAPSCRVVTSGQQSATFYIDGLQLEEGTTASDWALPEVDYSNAVLNPSAWTFEAHIDFDALKKTGGYLFAHYNGSSNVDRIACYGSSTTLYFIPYNVSGTATSGCNVSIASVTGIKSLKLLLDASKCVIWIDGVKVREVTTGINKPSSYLYPLYVGCSNAASGAFGGYISNLRISRIARTDTEMAYTGQLLPDEYTAYYSDMRHSISSRPFLINSSGQAENLLSEVGSRKTNQAIPAGLQLRAVAIATNTIDFSFALPNTMKANPTISGTYTETTSWKLLSTAGVQTTGFSLALLNAGTNQVGFRLTKTSHGLTDATLQFVTAVNLVA